MRVTFIVIVIFSLLLILFMKYGGEYLGDTAVGPGEDAVREPDKEDASIHEEGDEFLPIPAVTVVAEDLMIPWDIAFPNGTEMLVSERGGTLLRSNLETKETINIPVPDVIASGEGGLLGVALHPDFATNGYLYLYMTTTPKGASETTNKVVRFRLVGDALTDETTIIDAIPGARYHDGGRIAFGPDGYLYITTGDATKSAHAQNLESLSGKILRITDEGEIPSDNPFGTAVYSYGHRNPQGLSWDSDGNLWSTEHGRTTKTLTGMDEINIITPGSNYGWPGSEGDTVLKGTVAPILHSGPSVTWAPASALYYDGSLFFGGLRGETLYEAVLEGKDIIELRTHFVGEYGRIRTIVQGPDGAFYMTTSNRDGRGDPQEGDDTIIRLDPLQFRE